MTAYLLFIDDLDGTTGMLVGAVPVPPCFMPNDTFLDTVAGMGFSVALQTAEDFVATWGRLPGDVHLINGAELMDAVRYARSVLN